MFNKVFSENRAVCEIMTKNVVEPDRPQMALQYSACVLHAECLKLQTHTEYGTLIAFPRQQWLRERA
jgi:hypothetical protein